jgi:hypothetical protein
MSRPDPRSGTRFVTSARRGGRTHVAVDRGETLHGDGEERTVCGLDIYDGYISYGETLAQLTCGKCMRLMEEGSEVADDEA